MKRVAVAQISLLGTPEFKPGCMFGLAGPACIVHILLSSKSGVALRNSESVLQRYLGKPELSDLKDDCTFTHSARQVVSWYLQAHRRFGLIVHPTFRLGSRTARKDGTVSFSLALPYRFARPSLSLLALVLNLINKSATGQSNASEFESLISNSNTLTEGYREKGQNTPDLLKAAIKKDIPFHWIGGQTYRFGIGGAQRTLESSFTDNTRVIGVRLAKDKIKTAKLLNDLGLPGGSALRVSTESDLTKAVARIGFPVVVKPVDKDGGAGVSADLRSEEDVLKAFEIARKVSPNVMVDQHIEGSGYRFTIIFGEIIKVTAKAPWGIVGDGVSTITELVEKKLQSQAKTESWKLPAVSAPLLDEEALSLLRQYRMEPTSVLAADTFFALRRRNNANVGGSTVRLDLEKVHRDNRALALRVAELFLLDVAGIDLVIPDISRSWLEQRCLICDVNSQPQLGPSTCAEFFNKVIEGSGRVPVTLVLFSDAQSPVLDPEFQEFLHELKVDSVASSAGIWIRNAQVGRAGLSSFSAARAVLSYRDVFNPAVLMSVDDVHADGLPTDRFQRLVIVGQDSSIAESRRYRLHTAGASTQELVERDMLHCRLVHNPSDAASLLDKIWPHFLSVA